MSTKFEVFLHSRHVGVLSRSDADLSFQYDADVVSEYGVNSPCLSLSLPVSDIPIGGPQVSLYFDKLLPGDIARSKPTIGITGAVQVRPAGESAEALPESLTLTDQDLAIAIESTVMLRRNGDEWALPGNNLPATHLVKTVRPSDYTGPHLLPSEEWALRVARTAGLRAAEAYIETLAGREALIVTRFDLSPGGEVLHSEDFFQALALDEGDVFEESQAGLPSRLTRLVTIAAPHSIDEEEFKRDLLRAVTFNLLIGNGDAHSKNYSILIGKGGEIMLSPLYDTAPTFLLFEATTNAGHALDGQSSLTKLTLEHVILEGVAWGLNHEDARETAVAVLESAAEAAATQPAHAQAAELEPLSTRVTFLDPPGTEMYESVKLWREWGVPFTDASARTVQSGGPFAGEVNEESLLSVMLAEGSRRPDLLLRVVDTDGATKISIPLTGVTATSGASTGWMRLHATTPAQLLTFELRDDKNGKNPKVNFAVGNVDGNDPADVLAEIELISSIDPADSFFIEMMTGAQMLKGGGLTTPSSLLTHYRPVAAGLVSLQASATMNLVMPDIMEMLLGQFARFESFVAIYGGKAHIGKWQEISMTIPEDATPEQIEAAKSEIRAVSRGEHSPVAIEQPTISLADRSFVLARPIVTSRVSFTPVDDAVIDALGPGGTVVVTPGADDSVITAAVAGWTPDTQIRDLPLNPEVP